MEKELEQTRRRSAEEITRLVGIMARLRAPGGCPWDREQTFDSLKPYLVEEAYEVLDAMEGDSSRDHCEELGDLLFQVIFHAEIARENGDWDFADVTRAISDKIEYRHPHVFGDVTITDADEVSRNWVKLKAAEKARKKGQRVSVIEGVPRHAPGLLRAERITEKASRIGFDWPELAGVRAKVDEELAELDEALASGDPKAIEHELGDVLFALANLARHARTPAEDALRLAVGRFERRFLWVEERLHEQGFGAGQVAPLELMDRLWEEAKALEKQGELG
ncbi:nucleoside triphosphate pyrophosphohydrolase [Vulgatibacter sp.]|uniref:nucleoside triphosphate pyrophosphohydrolase n=1 Tax=Vulgatibacter sp. TaxID=1971226 RepID=UPI0035649B06